MPASELLASIRSGARTPARRIPSIVSDAIQRKRVPIGFCGAPQNGCSGTLLPDGEGATGFTCAGKKASSTRASA